MTNKEKAQNNNIDMIYESLDNLCRLANRKEYIPTDYEREVFGKIVNMVNNMNNWF